MLSVRVTNCILLSKINGIVFLGDLWWCQGQTNIESVPTIKDLNSNKLNYFIFLDIGAKQTSIQLRRRHGVISMI